LRQQSFVGLDGHRELAERAIAWFDKAIAANSYYPYPHCGKGMCLDWLGRAEEGAACFQRALALDPNGARTMTYLGWHYFQIKDYEASRQWLQKSLSLTQDERVNPMAWPYLMLTEEKLKEQNSTPPPRSP
jgi:tetratricopeptide (TPR) repeat protein